MAQLTKQDVADAITSTVPDIIEEVLDRKLDEKFDKKLDEKLDQKLDEKLDQKLGAFVEHLDDKFDGLAEAISIMNTGMQKLAKASDLTVIRQDIRTIKLAVKDTNTDLQRLERSLI
jgi:hypothetical protein